MALPAAALVWRRAKGPAPASGRRGRAERVRAKGRCASPDVRPRSQLGGLARGGARDATDEGARVGKGRRCRAELVRAKGRSASLDLGLSLQLEVLASEGGGRHLAGIGEGGGWRWAVCVCFFLALGWLLEVDSFGCCVLSL